MTDEKDNDNIPNAAAGFFKKHGIPNIDFSGVLKDTLNISTYNLDSINKDMEKSMEGYRNPTWDLVEMQAEANMLLEQISENTSVLKEIVEINKQTQLSNDELNKIMHEVLTIAQARDKEEADSFLKKAVDKINSSGETAGNIATLFSIAMNLYNTTKTMI